LEKANALHRWFMENVQDGNDDRKNYYVSKEDIEALLNTVNTVLDASALVERTITNGYRFENGKEFPIIEKGKYIKDPTVAQELLPTTDGFFFGSTDYDQYYYQDLVNTKKILEEALEEHEGNYEYQSSW
jgi:hypothetical protein